VSGATLPAAAIDVTTSIAGVPLASILLNEPEGAPTTVEQVSVFARSALGAIVTPTLVAGPSPLDRPLVVSTDHVLTSPDTSVVGFDDYAAVLDELAGCGTPVMVTVGGGSRDELVEVLRLVAGSRVDFVALDLSRRSTVTSRYHSDRRLVGLRVDLEVELLAIARSLVDVPIGIRQPIWLDPQNVRQWATALGVARPDFVTIAPPIAIGMLVDVTGAASLVDGEYGSPALGRLSGPAVKPINLAEISIARAALPAATTIVGTGGARTGTDVLDYLLVGASAVEIEIEQTAGRLVANVGGVLEQLAASGATSATAVIGALDVAW